MNMRSPGASHKQNLAETYAKWCRNPSEFRLLKFPSRIAVGAQTAEPDLVYLADAQPFGMHEELGESVREVADLIREGFIDKNDETKRILEQARLVGTILSRAILDAIESAVAAGGLALDGTMIKKPPVPANDVVVEAAPKATPAVRTRRPIARQREEIDPERIKQQVDIVEVIEEAGVRLKRQGVEHVGLCPFHNDHTPSFSVNRQKGLFYCRSCGATGNTIQFVERYYAVGFREACEMLTGDDFAPGHLAHPEPVTQKEMVDPYAGYVPVDPPANATELFQVGKLTPPILNIVRSAEKGRRILWQFEPSLVHKYRDATSKLIGFVLRRDFVADGKRRKETPAIQYVQTPDGDLLWARMHFAEPRPLYGRAELAANPERQVLVHEGEKSADAGKRLYGESLVNLAWSGGANAVARTDWSPVNGHSVLFWPDIDPAGYRAALGSERNGEWKKGAAELALEAGATKVAMINVMDPGKDGFVPTKEGWDCADAEAEGWDFQKTKNWIAERKISLASVSEVREAARRLVPEIEALMGPKEQPDAKPAPKATAPSAPSTPAVDLQVAKVIEIFGGDHELNDGQRAALDASRAQRAKAEEDGSAWDFEKKGTTILKDSQFNIRLAIRKLGVVLSHDEFAKRDLFQTKGSTKRQHLDDAAVTRMWLAVDEQFRFRPAKEFFFDVVIDAARGNSFHPVKDYLDSLKWDGVSRIDNWLTTYGGVDANEYSRAVGALTLVAAVRRVRQPGCKFDEMLLLITEAQGKNKSTALKVLASEEWFTDSFPLDADDKLVIEQTAGKWIVEAGELKGMREAESIKQLLSKQVDRARLAYGRLTVEVARQFIVIGTSNKGKPLTDPTGNRRFWPIDVVAFDVEALRRDRDQLWAEAAHREAQDISVRLPEALWVEAARHQEAHRAVDPWFERLAEALGKPDEGEHLCGKIRSESVWAIVGLTVERRDQRSNERLGAAIRHLGFEPDRLRFDGKLQYCYLRGGEEAHQNEILVEGIGTSARAYLKNGGSQQKPITQSSDEIPF